MEAQYSEHGAPLAHLELCVLLERLCAGLAPWPQVEGVHSGGHDTQQLHLLTQQGHTLCTLHCVKLTLNALVVVTHGMESFFSWGASHHCMSYCILDKFIHSSITFRSLVHQRFHRYPCTKNTALMVATAKLCLSREAKRNIFFLTAAFANETGMHERSP